MKKIIVIFFLILMTVTSGNAEQKKIVAAADPWPPFVDPSVPMEGLSMEIIRAAYGTQGYIVELVFVPWIRAEYGVRDGVYDILPDTWMTEKRKGYLAFSEAYAYNNVKFIKRKEDPFEFEGLESLNGKVVGTVRGYGYNDEFLSATNFTREEVVDFMTNIKKLVLSDIRLDLTLEDEIVARVAIANKNPEWLKKLDFTQNALSSNALYVTVGKKNPRHKELIEAFNQGLVEIKASGVYDEIIENYGIK